eukprot:6426778-Pyramimonas_sp.AAC.1
MSRWNCFQHVTDGARLVHAVVFRIGANHHVHTTTVHASRSVRVVVSTNQEHHRMYETSTVGHMLETVLPRHHFFLITVSRGRRRLR